MKNIVFCSTVFLALFTFCANPVPQSKQYIFHGATMGTLYNIKIIEAKKTPVDQNVMAFEIDSLLKNVNQMMSTYIHDSELSRLNQAPAGEWIPVSNGLMRVFQAAQSVSEKSGGAFDVTVGPLVNLWGFGPDVRNNELPAESEILARKALVGYHNLSLQKNPPAIKKAIAGMYCDLSAIAKGWGVDRAADFLEAKGHHHYMVEIGGEIRAKGNNVKGEPWRIGVSSPDAQFAIQKVIAVKDNGVATSGDYRNYFEKDGVRYSHTINPVTGCPITHKLASITVIHPSCMMADGFATAIDVLGPDAGMEFAERENLPIFMVVKSDAGFVEKKNPAFDSFIQK
jgi:FAD:protein FMN transferase